jgi:hypothetical protein
MHKPNYSTHTVKDIRGFTHVMSVFFSLIAGYLLWSASWGLTPGSQSSLAIAAFWLVSGFAFPMAIKPLHHAWMWLAFCLNFVMTRLILGVLFYVVMLPIGMGLRLANKVPLEQKGTHSNWKIRVNPTPSNHFEQLYSVESGEFLDGHDQVIESICNKRNDRQAVT